MSPSIVQTMDVVTRRKLRRFTSANNRIRSPIRGNIRCGRHIAVAAEFHLGKEIPIPRIDAPSRKGLHFSLGPSLSSKAETMAIKVRGSRLRTNSRLLSSAPDQLVSSLHFNWRKAVSMSFYSTWARRLTIVRELHIMPLPPQRNS